MLLHAKHIEKIVVFLTAYSFILYGLLFALAPLTMAALTLELNPTSTSAMIDLRSTYGGTNLAIGLFMLFLRHNNQVRACLWLVIIVLLSMAITRTLGLFLHGAGNAFIYLMLFLELLGSVLAAAALLTTRWNKSERGAS